MDEKRIAVVLRGHVRDSFSDNRLKTLLDNISKHNQVDIYIHTWNENEAKLSWRELDRSGVKEVNRKTIDNYLGDMAHNISACDIDDDENIELIGCTEGKICFSRSPILSWKKMWYGKNKVCQQLIKSNVEYELVINIRFDYFQCQSTWGLDLSEEHLLNTMDGCLKKGLLEKIHFLGRRKCAGIDNCYMGTKQQVFDVAKHFHENLDDIMQKYSRCNVQEYMVFYYVNNNYYPIYYDYAAVRARLREIKNKIFTKRLI
jgi:hypothetical protein